jgi:hypothetical protein
MLVYQSNDGQVNSTDLQYLKPYMLSKLLSDASENVEGRRCEGIGIGSVPADDAYMHPAEGRSDPGYSS